MNRTIAAISFAAALLAAGCFGDHERYYFSGKELERLLSGDSVKVWERTAKWVNGSPEELAGCEKYRYMAFAYNPRNPSERLYALFFLAGMPDCLPGPDSVVTIDSGYWEAIASSPIKSQPDTLALYDSISVKYALIIEEISPSRLVISQTSPQSGGPDILIREIFEVNP